MKKLLLDICAKHGYTSVKSTKGITLEMLIDGYLSGNVNLFVREKTGCAKQTVTNYIQKVFTDKPANSASTISWILLKDGLYVCSSCGEVLPVTEFYTNSSKYYGYSDFCKECSKAARISSYNKDPAKELHKNAIRKRRISEHQTPSWANIEKIEEIYRNRPIGYHVDHIIPLNGDKVCGLHVENNLQYLISGDNLSKSNKFIP